MSLRGVVVGAGLIALSACAAPELDPASFVSALRPDEPGHAPGALAFDAAEVVESWASPAGRVRVHFTRAGRNAVPLTDRDGGGVPDYVELVGTTYDAVRVVYHGELGLLEPLSDALLGGAGGGGDDRFDVYLVDFAGRGDGAYRREACLTESPSVCSGFMLQENDFAGYGYPSLTVAVRILASHEYFHAVQNAYDGDQDTIFSESTAVWATERFDPSLSDFEAFVGAYLSRVDRPLDVVSGGVVDTKSYGTAIFFQFLSERFDDTAVLALLDEIRDGARGVADPKWFEALDPYLARAYGVSFAEVFREFAYWNLLTAERADPARSYARGAGYPRVASERVELPYHLEAPRLFSSSTRYFSAAPGDRTRWTGALVVPEDRVEELASLALFLVRVDDGRVGTPVRVLDLRAGTEAIDVSGADEVLAYVVNTQQGGLAARPDLCLGTPEEVAACAAGAFAPLDGGVAGEGDAGDLEPPAPQDGGGCSATRASGPGSGAGSVGWAAWVVLAALGLWRRR